MISQLNVREIIRRSSNQIEVMHTNDTLCDYIRSRFRLEVRGDSRSLVVAESISEYLKRAPNKMAKFYRRSTAIGLRELMAVFDCQNIPVGMIDYETFSAIHKGGSPEEIDAALAAETEKIALPQIVYTANTVSLYSPISKLTEAERSAVALGFEAADYKDESEIVWIAAEIDSKLEADEELTAFWCDRLEMVGLMCGFSNYRLWLIAPEGFSPESVEVLKRRNAIGSSRAQIDLLAKYLGAEELVAEKLDSNEYEMVLPMGDDTELIAAYAVEEIARRHSFGAKAINQIKTALVEACINATEHSHSPDRKIYQKFRVEDDKIVITISNRGLRFKGKDAKEIRPDEGRRGWGIKLMRSLMDEVKFEQVDDGTRISMTKFVGSRS
ncbi:MAG: ATP-binding protein [Acidobacteria bacterium]|nr:ATP-binding protein [Acidobacteriota bacterium]